jgi:diguanylate cyclase (GGDEF)-like protein
MYDLLFSLLAQLVPFTVTCHLAVELFMRNRKSRLHQLAAALIFSLSISYLATIAIIVIPWEANLSTILKIEYSCYFLAMIFMNYYFMKISKARIKSGRQHALILIPLIGVFCLFVLPNFVNLHVETDGIWHVDKFSPGFAIIFFLLAAVSIVNSTIILYKAKLRIRKRSALVKEKYRIHNMFKGYIYSVVLLVISLIIRQAADVYWLQLLPAYCLLIWSYSIHNAMINYDVISTTSRRYEMLFEMGLQGKVLLNELGFIIEANQRFGHMIGREDRGVGTRFVHYISPSIQETFSRNYNQAYSGAAPLKLETEIKLATKETANVEVHSEYVEMEGDLFTFLIIRDITEWKRNEQTLYDLAYKDALTGLDNRWSFLDKLQRQLDESDKPSMVLLLDVDQFKLINDTLGHYAGDILLQQAAKNLASVLPEDAVLARLGGDEFVTQAFGIASHEQAAALANAIIDSFKTPIKLYGKPYKVTVSIGICLLPVDGTDSEIVLRNADSAMYSAKNSGRNCYQFFSPGQNTMTQGQLRMVNGLSDAMQNNEFTLFYQPQINLHGGGVLGVEALLRWNSSELGPVPPGVFIPLAEQSGLIVPIGDWVLRTAIAQMQKWIAAGYTDLVVSVNLSAHQLRVPWVAERVRSLLDEFGVPARNLCLEITETAAISDIDTSLRVCNQFVEQGITLAIDDFGVGYSSLGMLNRFPFHFIKIDRSLIQDIVESDRDLAIIRTVIELSGHLGTRVVAEGVETEEQVMLLKQLGCQEAQGYWYGKPMDVNAINKFLVRPGH